MSEDADFDEKYVSTKICLKRWLSNIESAGFRAQAPASNEILAQMLQQQTELIRRISVTNGNSNHESKVKLPVVKLPTFDGRMEEWKRFSETFQSLIHNNESIPAIQKFQYLATSLTGDAAKIIEAIKLTEDNYKIAWELLNKRFDDPRAIKKKHIQCLFTMPKVERESANAIQGLVDYTSKHLRILKVLKLPLLSLDLASTRSNI